MVLEQRIYQSVSATSSVSLDYVVPNGQNIILDEIGASCPGANSSVVITWDPVGVNQIILATSNESRQSTSQSFLGDGSKIMRITLTNTNDFPTYLGGYYLGRQES